MKKISVITGTRAEYGLLKPVLKTIQKHPQLQLSLLAGGMHLSYEFGYTINEILKDGFTIDAKFDMLLSDDTGARIAQSLGVGIIEFSQILELLQPNILLIYGDREEIFAAAITATCLNIPVAHIAGGEIGTGGHIDEAIRHSITKFAHIHFASTKKNAQRIVQMGEEAWRVYTVGSPALDTILHKKLILSKVIARKYSINLSQPIILVVQHPLTIQPEKSSKQIKETLEAVIKFKLQTILIYPNADAGGKKMINVIEKYEKYPFIKTFKNIPPKEYLSLMRIANVIVGNSSSGIIEAPSFHLPTVNIGPRQNGREKTLNVIDVGYNQKQIKKAIEKALYDKAFKKKVEKCTSPYGDGTASKKIVEVLHKTTLNSKLLHKKMIY
jgi:UDP-N-acetylglucosamine 2-epimerase (non-hydrolysing)/GDP/UDP-N,N'-diacetylbacillosamine 2-epimerase (hydrolysing)